MAYPAHGTPQSQRLSQPGGQALGQDLGAAGEATLLCSSGHVEEPVEEASGVTGEQEVEQRELGGLGREHAGHTEAEHGPAPPGPHVATNPGVDGLAVPGLGSGRAPRRLQRDVAGHAVQAQLGLAQVGEDVVGKTGYGAPVAALTAPGHQDVLSVVEGGEGGDAELGGQGLQPVLGGTDPLSPDLHDGAVGENPVEDPASDARAGLQHDDVETGAGQVPGRHQTSQTGAYNDHVDIHDAIVASAL